MIKVKFTFLEAMVPSEKVDSFIKKIEGVLKQFAGESYHFRYLIDEPTRDTSPKLQRINRERR
jgi:hypothetical protein